MRIMLAVGAGLAVATGIVAVGIGDSPPVRAENVACDTGSSLRCDATLVNGDDNTGYDLAVRLIGYDEDGEIVTTFTADATADGTDNPSIPPAGSKNVTISTAPADGVVEGDVRVVAVEPVAA